MGSPFHSVSMVYLNFCFGAAMTEVDTKRQRRDNTELKVGLGILTVEERLLAGKKEISPAP